jgi:hypothetical protein
VSARAAAALAALLLLPGLLVVRAPWTAVPFLSLFFWIASWWWLPSVGRARFVGAALAAFVLAAVLRLLRFDGRRPSWPPLLALAAALLHAAIGLMSAPARLETVPAQLMVWHDGLPKSYVPLREAGRFGAHAHGLDGLAADLAQLSGLRVTGAVALASAAARGLSSIGLYALLARLSAPAPAALATLGVTLVAGALVAVDLGLAPAASVALGFSLTASGLLARSPSRSAAVAAGAFAGAAAMTQPRVVAMAIAAGMAVAAFAWTRLPGPERDARWRRLLLAGAVAAVTAAPFLLQVGIALLRG